MVRFVDSRKQQANFRETQIHDKCLRHWRSNDCGFLTSLPTPTFGWLSRLCGGHSKFTELATLRFFQKIDFQEDLVGNKGTCNNDVHTISQIFDLPFVHINDNNLIVLKNTNVFSQFAGCLDNFSWIFY